MAARSSAVLRRRLVLGLERKGCITRPEVREAFLSVPRERFLPDYCAAWGLEAVYRDEAILTRRGPRGEPLSSSSQPAIMALMLEHLGLFPGARVLEVGAGTGYNAALISSIVGQNGTVVSIELDPATAAEAREALAAGGHEVLVAVGDGRAGFAAGAPFDRIVVTASTNRIARSWHEQLAPDGLLQVPLWIRGPELQLVTTLLREDEGFGSISALTGAFMPLRSGEAPGPPESADDGESELPALRGPALERMGERERERLLSLTRADPRVRRVAAMSAWPLWFFLRVTIPDRLLVYGRQAVGVATPDARSLALLERGGPPGRHREQPRAASFRSWGSDSAETLLRELVDRWRSRGRPGEGDLVIRVRFDGDRSRLRCRWRRHST